MSSLQAAHNFLEMDGMSKVVVQDANQCVPFIVEDVSDWAMDTVHAMNMRHAMHAQVARVVMVAPGAVSSVGSLVATRVCAGRNLGKDDYEKTCGVSV